MKQLTSMKKIVFAVCIVFALLSAALLITGFAMNANEPAFTDPVLVVSAEEAAGETVGETQPAEETAEETEDSSIGAKAIGAGIAVGLAAAAGAVGMGIAVAKTSEATARQPEAEGKIRSSLMLGLVFIETAIIYALIVAILIIFVL